MRSATTSWSQSNLNKLKALQNQTAGLGRDITGAQQKATSEMGVAKGLVDTEKASQALQMRNLRDRMYAQLQTERDAVNKVGQADAADFTDEELRSNLVNKAGYTLEANPYKVKFPNGHSAGSDLVNGTPTAQSRVQTGGSQGIPVGGAAPIAGTTGGQVGLPVEPTPGYADSLPKDYINLNRNMNFGAEDVGVFAEGTRPQDSQYATDVNRSLTRKIAEKNGFGDFEHTSYGSPNAEQALIGIQNLKPLFTQSYTDNTVASINADLLNRRNVLSQVLQDDTQNGILTPQQRSEVETQLNDAMLTKLKQTPKMAEEQFSTDFRTAAPGGGGTLSAVRQYKELGYENPLDLMKYIGFSINSLHGLSGAFNGQPIWNPVTKKIDMTLYNGKVKASMSGDEFLNKYAYTPHNKINNNASSGPIATKLRELNILKRLKELGINEFTTDKGKRLGVDENGRIIGAGGNIPEEVLNSKTVGGGPEEGIAANQILRSTINSSRNIGRGF